MKVTFLGTGTSSGVPVVTCKCEVCKSIDYRDKRLRVSILLELGNTKVVIDSGPDFRQQILRQNISHLDAVVFTHEHKDHTAGLDDIRPFNYLAGYKYLPIYAHSRVLSQLKQEYYYAFQENAYPGVPLLECHEIDGGNFTIGDLTFKPIDVLHHKLQVYGFRIADFTYITDANFISEIELDKLKGTKTLVLNALQINKHISHFSLQEAIDMVHIIKPQQAYFTHISHKLGLHSEVSKTLPENISLAYDGLSLKD